MLNKSVAYFANGVFSSLFETAQPNAPKIVIVARKHYSIQQQSYPALSLTELKSLLKIKSEQASTLKPITIIEVNKDIDGFNVTTIQFTQHLELLAKAWVLIPETTLLYNHNDEKSLLQLTTPAGELFYSQTKNTSHSAYAQGLINNLATYKHSVGIADTAQTTHINSQQYFAYLANMLTKKPFSELLKQCMFNFKQQTNPIKLHLLYIAPLLSVTLYIAIAFGWQWLSVYNLQNKMGTQSEQANQVLAQKNELDALNKKIGVFNQYIGSKNTVYEHWDIINSVLKNDMTIDIFSQTNGQIQLRGSAPNANKVINAVSQNPNVAGVIFAGGVRKYKGEDKFTLQITLKMQTQEPSNEK
ncbi:hypothetical protein NQU47_06035 [Pseudoalteromonas distincta]|uniref:hypothetical protein n=1 Tax=Pseudoalteromonas distincta TaxID=77608 RepID=UPI00234108A8|nr:hypothetical protein [Pseudoalteromonas distincta]MDC3212123.1 hypothetical protein [Pseudoalteromonas distincta]